MKNVLLLIHDDVGQEARLQCALDLTRAIEGHLSCLDVAIMPRFMDEYVSTGGEALLIADEQEKEARNRDRLEQRLVIEDVPWSWTDVAGGLADSVLRALHLNDIVVVSAHLDRFPHREMAQLAGELIVKSEKPLLAVPQQARGFEVCGHALVAWDGSPTAEAALRAAVPLLALADAVTLLEVDDGSVCKPAEEAAAYLSRHGIKPVVRREPAGLDVASGVILNMVRRLGATWLVMGGFGHRRWVEATFGGVTQRLFREVKVPLLLAH
ncbi:MAG: universal stress protein [Sphingomonas sp.]